MSTMPLNVLKDEKAPAMALLAVAIKRYGVESLEWSPEILRAELEDDYDIKLSDLQSDKLQAAATILTTDAFEQEPWVFTTCCHLLCSVPYEFSDFSPIEPEYIAMALAEVYLIRDGDLEEFGDEVRAFAGKAFHDYGMMCAPAIFPQALMPGCDEQGKVEESDKSEAMTELFNARTAHITKYMEELGKHYAG